MRSIFSGYGVRGEVDTINWPRMRYDFPPVHSYSPKSSGDLDAGGETAWGAINTSNRQAASLDPLEYIAKVWSVILREEFLQNICAHTAGSRATQTRGGSGREAADLPHERNPANSHCIS
jgi:hypothetical protein